MHLRFSATLVAAIVFCLAVFTLPARADELATTGRELAARWQGSVITLQITIKSRMNMFGQENSEESKEECTGMVIDPTGLVVTSLAGINPAELMSSMMSDALGDKASEMKMSSEITGVKLLLADGKELPAQIVLRDKDLDLAFIRPLKKPATSLAALEMTQTATPALFDQVIALERLGPIANRTLSLLPDRVKAVVEKPRTFFVLATELLDLGSPVFTQEGKLVGMTVLRLLPKGTSRSLLGSGTPPYLTIVLPAVDIAEAAKQAPETTEGNK